MVRIHPDPPRTTRGCSSVGRAPALQAGGRRFDPVQLHQYQGSEVRAGGTEGGGGFREGEQTEVTIKRDAAGNAVIVLASGFCRMNRLFFNNAEEVKRSCLQGTRGGRP